MTSSNITENKFSVTVNEQSNLLTVTAPEQLNFVQSGTGATSRTVASKLKDIVNVADFGATGNGTTDDTAAIQAAIDSLHTHTGDDLYENGGVVEFNVGTYLISSTLNLTKKTHLVGKVGYFLNQFVDDEFKLGGTTIKLKTRSNTDMLKVQLDDVSASLGADYRSHCSIRNIHFHGNRSEKQSPQNNDDLKNSEFKITQANITEANPGVFTSTGHGLNNGDTLKYTVNGTQPLVTSAGSTADNTVFFVVNKTDNTFQLSSTSGGPPLEVTNDGNDAQTFITEKGNGIVLSGVRYVTLENVIITKCALNGLQIQSNTYSSTNTTISTNNIDIRACAFHSNGSSGANLAGGDSIMDNCTIGYNGNNGITVAGFGIISNSLCWNNFQKGIFVQGTNEDPTIVGNKIYDNGQSGISLSDQESGDSSGTASITANKILRNGALSSVSSGSNASGVFINSTATGEIIITGNEISNSTDLWNAGKTYTELFAINNGKLYKYFKKAQTISTSIIDTSTNKINLTNHGYVTGIGITYKSNSGTALALEGSNIADDTVLFVVKVDDNNFKLAEKQFNIGFADITQDDSDPKKTKIFNVTAHGLSNGDTLVYNSNGGDAMKIGGSAVADDTTFFVVNKTDNTFELSLSSGGTAIELSSSDGSGFEGNNNQIFRGADRSITNAGNSAQTFTASTGGAPPTHIEWNDEDTFATDKLVETNNNIYKATTSITGGTEPSHLSGTTNGWLFVSSTHFTFQAYAQDYGVFFNKTETVVDAFSGNNIHRNFVKDVYVQPSTEPVQQALYTSSLKNIINLADDTKGFLLKDFATFEGQKVVTTTAGSLFNVSAIPTMYVVFITHDTGDAGGWAVISGDDTSPRIVTQDSNSSTSSSYIFEFGTTAETSQSVMVKTNTGTLSSTFKAYRVI